MQDGGLSPSSCSQEKPRRHGHEAKRRENKREAEEGTHDEGEGQEEEKRKSEGGRRRQHNRKKFFDTKPVRLDLKLSLTSPWLMGACDLHVKSELDSSPHDPDLLG